MWSSSVLKILGWPENSFRFFSKLFHFRSVLTIPPPISLTPPCGQVWLSPLREKPEAQRGRVTGPWVLVYPAPASSLSIRKRFQSQRGSSLKSEALSGWLPRLPAAWPAGALWSGHLGPWCWAGDSSVPRRLHVRSYWRGSVARPQPVHQPCS